MPERVKTIPVLELLMAITAMIITAIWKQILIASTRMPVARATGRPCR